MCTRSRNCARLVPFPVGTPQLVSNVQQEHTRGLELETVHCVRLAAIVLCLPNPRKSVQQVLSAKVALLYVVPVRRGVTAKEALATAANAHQERLLLEGDLNVFPASQENTH